MTDPLVRADCAAWASALSSYKAARGNAAAADIVNAGNAMLDLHAPDIEAVIEKLMFLLEPGLWEENDHGRRLRTIIGDLRRAHIDLDQRTSPAA